MSDVTLILQRLERGDGQAADELLPLIYDDLRKAAAAQLSQEASGHTLQPTALVHEAYVRLVDRDVQNDWHHRGHFFAAAAEAMRRILVEHARKKKALKRGGDRQRADLDPDKLAFLERRDDLIALDQALDKLEAQDARKAELVKLRYFAGLTMPQAAEALGISLATAERDWKYARVWLLGEMIDES
ncbi:MAG TPA: sigma-70 family RNA polymerase sigma factor [Planctomycetaceae bacterium]|nr:sigma-70 family RNA polymerase sigma factor [Planctomycetaceae bacterium]